jgi:hypothetical protein
MKIELLTKLDSLIEEWLYANEGIEDDIANFVMGSLEHKLATEEQIQQLFMFKMLEYLDIRYGIKNIEPSNSGDLLVNMLLSMKEDN